jgi:indolepyruvate ferredoxin oxidoreductase alpha subunit
MRRILMGNEAIGLAIVEAGCEVACSYPGTPASEILEAVVAFAAEGAIPLHAEWSVNEKVAYEVALAASYTGKRAAVSMKQVGLNVAADPYLRSAYLGVVGGLVLVSADDPGPHSSQTEQDSRFFAMFARLPVFDPSNPVEAREMVKTAYALSEAHEIPVMVRPTTRVCHARQDMEYVVPSPLPRRAAFRKNPDRLCATPGHMRELTRRLNDAGAAIAADTTFAPRLNPGDGRHAGPAIVASGVVRAHLRDLLEDEGLAGAIDVYEVSLPYPLHAPFAAEVGLRHREILVLEETYPVMELQLRAGRIRGRLTGDVPNQGELTPEVVLDVVDRFLRRPERPRIRHKTAHGPRPTLCAGCGHRAAFYAMKKAMPGGIFPGDIGCYTLGVNLGAVDTCHCMGAGISQGTGFYHAYAQNGGKIPPIAATIGDSTFFHAGIPALVNAVTSGARFVIVILDNSTTAMTGHQPTPALGTAADGSPAPAVSIAALARACGVAFVEECDPYDVGQTIALMRRAHDWSRSSTGGMAVVIARRPCVVDRKAPREPRRFSVSISEKCVGCGVCVKTVECPALAAGAGGAVSIDQTLCTGCGVCRFSCPSGAIVADAP